jgi:hypothetical protein
VLTTSKIHCIWYPSGGFGHYINAILSLYGHGFARPKKVPVFSKEGNSHSLDLVAPAYYKEPEKYNFEFDPALNYSVIVDNGINNESLRFRQFFPSARVIKMCYSDFSWPVVAHTMFVKAMNQHLKDELTVDLAAWQEVSTWAQREKYFLFLRDHSLRHAWKPDNKLTTIMIEDLLDYNVLRNRIGVNLDNFEDFWTQWYNANESYFRPVLLAQKILQGQFEPVNDIWTQAVVYYQIWCKYGIEVPHNDYSNWFESYEDIVKMLEEHGVDIDSN